MSDFPSNCPRRLETQVSEEISAISVKPIEEDLAVVLAKAIQKHITPQKVEFNEDKIKNLINESIADSSKIIKIENTELSEIKDIGLQHKDFEKLLTLAQLRMNIFLVGPSGSGKTHIVKSISEALNLSFNCVSVGLQTSKSDLIGYKNATGKIVKTPLRLSYENGGVFLMDEIDAGNANVLTVINTILSNNMAGFPDMMVERHKNFIFFCTGNTFGRGADYLFVGRNQIDASTLDRFLVWHFDYDEQLERTLARNNKWVDRVQKIRKNVTKHKEKLLVTPRSSILGARLLNVGFSQQDVEEMLIWRGVSEDVRNRVG